MGVGEAKGATGKSDRDDLQAIKGIGRATADAFYKIGIRRFADITQYTPDKLSKDLLEKADLKILSEKIKASDWIGQAKKLAQQTKTDGTPAEMEAKAAKEKKKALVSRKWHQHAGFSIFFDNLTNKDGEQIWQTRAYHDESGKENLFSGIEIGQCVNWILERAKLPAFLKPAPSETPPPQLTSYDAQIDIYEVQVSELPTTYVDTRKNLEAEVYFNITGPDAEKLTMEGIPFRIEVHTVEAKSRTSNIVASKTSHLKPQIFDYKIQQKFTMPKVGRYELHGSLFFLPPNELMLYQRGPIINIVP